MPKVSPNSIRSANDNWARDERNGLPYSGEAIQNFIRSSIGNSVGAAYFNPNNFVMYFFRNEEDRDAFINDESLTDLIVSSAPMNLTSDMHRIMVTNRLPSYTVQAATNQEEVELALDFDVQTKQITDSVWTSTGEGVTVKAYVDRGATGFYTEIPLSGQSVLVAGTTFRLNVRDYITVGSNRIKIEFHAESNESISASVVYSVTLSEMYIEEFNNNWYNAIVEGVDTNYQLGGFRIVGSLSKTLHIEIYRENTMVASFEQLIGVSSYVDTPYHYTKNGGLDLSSLATGVYICRAYLTAGTLVSLPVVYNFMYVAADDRFTAELTCVNNTPDTVSNYSTAGLCEYAIYNKGQSSGTPHILIQLWSGTTPTTKVDQDYPDTTTGEKHRLDYTIEWLIQETVNLFVYFNISYGSCSQVRSIAIDNTSVFPAEAGADFYMNADTRTNNDANRTSILNEASNPASEIAATWQKMAWVDGIDGWTHDPYGRRALLIPAFSKCSIPYRVMQGQNMAFEMCFRVANVSDYNANVITAADNPDIPGFYGIRIRPTGITIHSSADTDDSNDVLRGKSFGDEQTIHLIVSIQTNYNGNQGKNLVTCYVNGCKNLEFSFSSGTAWENNANLIIGSDAADVYVYYCRVYRKALGTKAAEQNYINSLRSLEERQLTSAWFNSVLNENTHELLIDKVMNANEGYNFFIVEMRDGATVPSRANGWSKTSKGFSDFEMHFGKHPEWDFKLFNVETSGQGTTSMDYYRWNLRWRIDKSSGKAVLVAYYDTPSMSVDGNKQYNILPSASSKSVWFDGANNHPAVMRITAKTNQASSMQSHKMGATRAYNDLQQALGLYNEAQEFAAENGLPSPTTAVYQYPAFGFSKKMTAQGVPVYEFIGLFTIGPDKGDKGTFGYNIDSSIKDELITMEGTDHSRRMAKFNAPWNSDVKYLATNECLNIVRGNNDYDNAWEVGNCEGLSTDDVNDQAAIETVLEREFKPAYDVAYNNSTLIFGIALGTYGATAADTLAYINANIETFRNTAFSARFTYADMEFWIEGEYILYHYDFVTGQFVAGTNLALQNGAPEGSTVQEQNEWFKAQRRERFKSEAPAYWDIQDTIYHFVFLLVFAATDNFAKNSYPYKMKRLANGGRWKWRQDDLDTLADIDNRGADTKPYYIEFEDAEGGSTYFAGSTSIFWNLMYEAFWDDYGTSKGIESFGREFVNAMAAIGGGSNVYESLMNFWKKYFWDNAQNYFPSSAYNVDAEWKYDAAWLANGQAVDPLSQAQGDHYLAEKLWFSRRSIYIMSLFKCGPFGTYSDVSLGQIAFRPQSLASVALTPMMWMYPALANGAGSPEATARTQEGQTHVFVGPFGTDGQTTFYIQASNFLRSLGDLKDLVLSAQYVDTIAINAAKLKTFKIGDADAALVTTNVPLVAFNNTRCLEEIDARNAESITGSIDLTVCTRLKVAMFEGTNIAQVTLPNGSKIEILHLSDITNTVRLKNVKYLAELVLPSDPSVIRTLQIENCGNQNGLALLRSAFNAEDSKLQFIRILLDEVETVSGPDIQMLSLIADNKDKDGDAVNYRGINTQGDIEGTPVLEGTMQLDSQSGMYLTDLDNLGLVGIEDYGEGLKRAICSAFGALNIIYDPSRLYIPFADEEVKRIVKTNWGDGVGLLYSQAPNVKSLNNRFRGNTTIVSFDEFQHFTGVTTLEGQNDYEGQFCNCTSLQYITIPTSIKSTGFSTFQGCKSLRRINIEHMVTLNRLFAYGCRALEIDINCPLLTTIGYRAFQGSGIKKIISLGSITEIPDGGDDYNGVFGNCTNLTEVTLPNTLTKIGNGAFSKCTSLAAVSIQEGVKSIGRLAFNNCALTEIVLPSTITTLSYGAFLFCSSLRTVTVLATTPPSYSTALPTTIERIYVPYGCGDAYKAATGWSGFAAKIFELDENGNIPE